MNSKLLNLHSNNCFELKVVCVIRYSRWHKHFNTVWVMGMWMRARAAWVAKETAKERQTHTLTQMNRYEFRYPWVRGCAATLGGFLIVILGIIAIPTQYLWCGLVRPPFQWQWQLDDQFVVFRCRWLPCTDHVGYSSFYNSHVFTNATHVSKCMM